MKDDVSLIPTYGCPVLTSSDTITWYYQNQRRDFVFNGGKWHSYRSISSTYNYDISSYSCIDISNLNSNAAFEPIFYMIAFILFIVTILIFRWSVRGVLGRY